MLNSQSFGIYLYISGLFPRTFILICLFLYFWNMLLIAHSWVFLPLLWCVMNDHSKSLCVDSVNTKICKGDL